MTDKNIEIKHAESAHGIDWNKQQFLNPNRMPVAFEKFISRQRNISKDYILDLGCGGGGADIQFFKSHPDMKIDGIDVAKKLFDLFDLYADENTKKYVKLYEGDWYNLDKSFIGKYDGIISLRTLSWLDDWKIPAIKICELNPKWIALSSLFYEGKVSYQIRVTDYTLYEGTSNDENDSFFYNIYSIPLIKEFLAERGYNIFVAEPFEIDIDLPKPKSLGTGTYTIKTEDGKRLQISAAMLMPWYFIFASKQ